jgi:hypothetical protein
LVQTLSAAKCARDKQIASSAPSFPRDNYRTNEAWVSGVITKITYWTPVFLIAKLKNQNLDNLKQFGNFKNNELIVPDRFKITIDSSEVTVVATHKELRENEALFQLIF